jgi:hypothetical protein
MDVGLGRQIHGQMILVRGFGEDLHVRIIWLICI